jgi:hypothetical protein
VFYRFDHPADPTYPYMLELFSRTPDVLTLDGSSHLTPIPVDDSVSSLSAILLDDDYYRFIHDSKRLINGVPIVGPECLIPLKAHAWLQSTALRAAGTPI